MLSLHLPHTPSTESQCGDSKDPLKTCQMTSLLFSDAFHVTQVEHKGSPSYRTCPPSDLTSLLAQLRLRAPGRPSSMHVGWRAEHLHGVKWVGTGLPFCSFLHEGFGEGAGRSACPLRPVVGEISVPVWAPVWAPSLTSARLQHWGRGILTSHGSSGEDELGLVESPTCGSRPNTPPPVPTPPPCWERSNLPPAFPLQLAPCTCVLWALLL